MSIFDQPYYSICKLGSDRYFWAAWASYDAACEGQVLGEGYTAARGEAEQRAQIAVGPQGQDMKHAGFASHRHRALAAQRRTARLTSKPPKIADAAPTEYLYTSWLSDYDNERRWSAHRIVKRTAKKVFVLDQELSPEWLAKHPEDLRTIALDRQKLERDGYATNSNTCSYFYTEKAMQDQEAQHYAYRPPCIIALGLSWPCTLDAVKQAWRELARKLHPDHGGDAATFRETRSHYEAALRLVGGAR